MRQVIYLAGPYRDGSVAGLFANIMRARDIAMLVWARGHVPLCPHLNSMLMDGQVPDEDFISGDLLLLERCDGILMLPGWEDSVGARRELAHARQCHVREYFAPQDIPAATGDPSGGVCSDA